MKRIFAFSLPALLVAAASVHAETTGSALVVTASNASNNQLLVYDTSGNLVQSVPTEGNGGVGGNAGGIEARGDMLAVVNFGSKNVSIFGRQGNGFHVTQLVPAVSGPVSVAFGNGHLYVLGTTTVESHPISGSQVNPSPDGTVPLALRDGSAAQVGVVTRQLVITEKNSDGTKSGVIETVDLSGDGSVNGQAEVVKNMPDPALAPFGLVTRGKNAYVTIAHSDEISLVRNGNVLTVTPSMTQHAPCWLALKGPFLYSSNSPSHSISRYLVYGTKIVQQEAVAASVNGAPTDIAAGDDLIAVIDGGTGSSGSHLSVFGMDENGGLKLKAVATIPAAINGVAIIGGE